MVSSAGYLLRILIIRIGVLAICWCLASGLGVALPKDILSCPFLTDRASVARDGAPSVLGEMLLTGDRGRAPEVAKREVRDFFEPPRLQ